MVTHSKFGDVNVYARGDTSWHEIHSASASADQVPQRKQGRHSILYDRRKPCRLYIDIYT